MSKMKFVFVVVMLLGLLGIVQAQTVVHDPANFLWMIDNFKTIKQNWDSLIGSEKGIMSTFTNKLEKLKAVAEQSTMGMLGDELNGLNMLDIQKYMEGPFFKDTQGVEVWKDFFTSQSKLSQKFTGLDYYNEEFKKDNEKDPELVTYLEDNQKMEKEYVQNLQNVTDFIGNMRKWEQERADKIKQYSELIQRFAQGQNGVGQTSNLEAVANAIRLEILKAESQMLAVNRVMMETELKTSVVKIDQNKRYHKMKDDVQKRKLLEEAAAAEKE